MKEEGMIYSVISLAITVLYQILNSIYNSLIASLYISFDHTSIDFNHRFNKVAISLIFSESCQ